MDFQYWLYEVVNQFWDSDSFWCDVEILLEYVMGKGWMYIMVFGEMLFIDVQ